ncbi:MAG: ECF-type sigma factor [Pseudomonadota bacterium]
MTAQADENAGGLTSGDITQLLEDWQQGDANALNNLVPLLYAELRDVAAGYLRRERPDHTLQPTALVGEAYVRLHKRLDIPFESRKHFLAAAAKAMRNILVDHARKLSCAKRQKPFQGVTMALQFEEDEGKIDPIDLLALNQAMERLAKSNERHASIVELRYFGGLTNSEVASVLSISEPTVKRDWKVARLALSHWLANVEPSKEKHLEPGDDVAL